MAEGILRIYTDSFTNSFLPDKLSCIGKVKECQVALAFARDYDENGKYTCGKFVVHWHQDIAPAAIWDFKQKQKTLHPKVLVSIGQRGCKYPFYIEEGKKEEWICNATKSLKEIIQTNKLDGIDVYYEQINVSCDDFVEAIGKLITNLKNLHVATVASIAPTAPLNNDFYIPLYNEYKPLIDNVVYQCHTEVDLLPDPKSFVEHYIKATTDYDNVLAGYSAIYIDWKTLSLFVFMVGVAELLKMGTKGVSIWFGAPNLLCYE